MLLLYTLRNL